MRTALTALTEELRRLKVAGVNTVSISPESLERLHAVVAKRQLTRGPSVENSDDDSEWKPPAISSSPTARTPAKKAPKKVEPALPEPPTVSIPEGDKQTRWAALREMVLQNKTCRAQVHSGKQVVFGVGDINARIMLVGEAPGAEEETQGEPFVGPAGQLLTKMIGAMGLSRDEVYIGNIMNWRPQMPAVENGEQFGNRPPNAEEMAFCLPFLRAQIEIVAPQVIVALGATAARGLLGHDAFRTLGEVRGKWHQFADQPLMVTYHPSYILRNQSNRSKRLIWEDLLQVMDRVELPVTDKQRSYFLSN